MVRLSCEVWYSIALQLMVCTGEAAPLCVSRNQNYQDALMYHRMRAYMMFAYSGVSTFQRIFVCYLLQFAIGRVCNFVSTANRGSFMGTIIRAGLRTSPARRHWDFGL